MLHLYRPSINSRFKILYEHTSHEVRLDFLLFENIAPLVPHPTLDRFTLSPTLVQRLGHPVQTLEESVPARRTASVNKPLPGSQF